MRITDIKASIVFGRSVFVRVSTDDGVSGLGECSPMHLGAAAYFVNTVLRPLCVGLNPLEVEHVARDYIGVEASQRGDATADFQDSNVLWIGKIAKLLAV